MTSKNLKSVDVEKIDMLVAELVNQAVKDDFRRVGGIQNQIRKELGVGEYDTD